MMTEYKGIEMQQNGHAVFLFPEFLKKENFKNIIEIGTRYGAFTRFLKDNAPESCEVYTYNIMDQLQVDPTGIHIRIKNIFDEEYQNILDEEVLNVINSGSKNLVLCDGWNKIKEFNCFARYIKKGDVLMAHDYAPDQKYYEENIKGRIWGWCETTEAPIADSSAKYGLIHYNQEEFQKAVWLCKIKT